jgi:acetyl esterase/lipase
VIVCPGGGYGGLAVGHEGDEIAKFLNSFGVSAFVLHYRLGSNGYHHPIQLGDAQRAIRTVRSDAAKYGIVADRIGIMGFSAGGHLASTAGTHFDAGKPDSEDAVEKVGCRPDFLILCYPVVSFTTKYTHRGSLRNLLGNQQSDRELVKNLSNELQVTKETPPTFLFHTNEDRGVPPENSILFYMALRKVGVPAEMHIYQKGDHGIGLTRGGEVNATWGNRLKGWMQVNGWLAKP